MAMEVTTDPSDGLPAIVTGPWTKRKHKLLRHYVDISRAARKGWVDPAEANRRNIPRPQGASYIELFCGPGRVCIDGSFEPGSPLVACDEAIRTETGFTAIHLGDERADFCSAVTKRLAARGVTPIVYPKRAQLAAEEVVKVLNPHGLNFAFLDAFGFEDLPFTIIETLGRFKRMDVLIYVSAMGLQRDLPGWMDSKQCALDDFAPDWRSKVDGRDPSDIKTRGLIFDHWLTLIKNVGFRPPVGKPPLIRGSNNQPLYWLVLVAKHDLATKFWKAISQDEDQHEMPF
jgi:three-Cys-motif partner protein